MRMRMRRAVLTVLATLTVLVLAAPNVRAVEAADRFKGGSSDGYDYCDFYKKTLVRFQGGGFDGYSTLTAFGLKVPLRGTMICIY